MALSTDLCYSIEDIRLLHEYHAFYSSVIWYSGCVMSIVTFLVGLVGNAFVIWFFGFIVKKHKSRYWFLNLAIADFLAFLNLPFHAISTLKGTWIFGPHMCKLFIFCFCANMYSSIYILIALNIVRVLSVAKPMFHHKFISQRVSVWICSFIWFIVILLTLPMLYYIDELKVGNITLCSIVGSQTFSSIVVKPKYNVSSENTTRGILVPDIYNNLNPFIGHCLSEPCCVVKETLDLWNNVIFITKRFVPLFLITGYFIPLVIVIICNISIVVHVRKSTTINTHRLYRTLLIIIMVYFITWTPLVVAQIVILISAHNINFIVFVKVITFIPLLTNTAYANSCLNPIVYVMSSRRMRTGLSDLINRIRKI